MAKILVIEDEDNLRLTISRTLGRTGHEVTEAANLRDARAALAKSDFDLVLTDIMLGEEQTGLDLVRELRATSSGFDGVIVVMTAFTSVENAVAAMREGADDYLQKPLSLEELGLQVGRWIEHRRLKQRVKLYERMERSRDQENEVVGESPSWRHTLTLAQRMAHIALPDAGAISPAAVAHGKGRSESKANVLSGSAIGGGSPLACILITGETGAGKGVIARYIHAQALASAKQQPSEAPFVHVNCSALPATLVEAELFGHEKGAFTDAREAKAGLFEMADGGTIFLDEVSETPLEFQAKLLTVVEQGVYRRVGGTRERRVRVRVIAASNQDLEARVKAGAFRRDLLYRLNAFTLPLPALRQRLGDAVRIAEVMLERLGKRYGRAGVRLSDEARRAVETHLWPGNVRELVNGVHRAVMLAEGNTIEPEDLGLDIASPVSHMPTDFPGRSNGHGSGPVSGGVGVGVGGALRGEPGMGASWSTGGGNTAGGRAVNPVAGTRGESRVAGDEKWNGATQLSEAQEAPDGAGSTGGLHFDFERGIHTAAEVEKELIMQALRHTRGNVSRAAKLIAMQRSSLRYRIDRYGLEHFVVEVASR